MNQFGADWTEAKMDIVVSYAKAYLAIMQKQHWVKTIYFLGFVASGFISSDEENNEERKGTALRILAVIESCPFSILLFC